jgi:uncharacterized protein
MTSFAEIPEEHIPAPIDPKGGDAAREAVRAGLSLDPAAAWLALRASSAAPSRIGSMLELEGFLTGVLVAPSPIDPSRWIAGLWSKDDPVFDDEQKFTAAFESVMDRYNTLSDEIEASLERLQTEHECDWRPAFQPAHGKPSQAAIRQWAKGFWTAASLDPAGWSTYIDDKRARIILTPLMGFAPFSRDEIFDPADDIEDLLDEAADHIPRSILLLRMIAQMRAELPSRRNNAPSRPKIGRNDPCLCGSGRKYKRCCGGA